MDTLTPRPLNDTEPAHDPTDPGLDSLHATPELPDSFEPTNDYQPLEDDPFLAIPEQFKQDADVTTPPPDEPKGLRRAWNAFGNVHTAMNEWINERLDDPDISRRARHAYVLGRFALNNPGGALVGGYVLYKAATSGVQLGNEAFEHFNDMLGSYDPSPATPSTDLLTDDPAATTTHKPGTTELNGQTVVQAGNYAQVPEKLPEVQQTSVTAKPEDIKVDRIQSGEGIRDYVTDLADKNGANKTQAAIIGREAAHGNSQWAVNLRSSLLDADPGKDGGANYTASHTLMEKTDAKTAIPDVKDPKTGKVEAWSKADTHTVGFGDTKVSAEEKGVLQQAMADALNQPEIFDQDGGSDTETKIPKTELVAHSGLKIEPNEKNIDWVQSSSSRTLHVTPEHNGIIEVRIDLDPNGTNPKNFPNAEDMAFTLRDRDGNTLELPFDSKGRIYVGADTEIGKTIANKDYFVMAAGANSTDGETFIGIAGEVGNGSKKMADIDLLAREERSGTTTTSSGELGTKAVTNVSDAQLQKLTQAVETRFNGATILKDSSGQYQLVLGSDSIGGKPEQLSITPEQLREFFDVNGRLKNDNESLEALRKILGSDYTIAEAADGKPTIVAAVDQAVQQGGEKDEGSGITPGDVAVATGGLLATAGAVTNVRARRAQRRARRAGLIPPPRRRKPLREQFDFILPQRFRRPPPTP